MRLSFSGRLFFYIVLSSLAIFDLSSVVVIFHSSFTSVSNATLIFVVKRATRDYSRALQSVSSADASLCLHLFVYCPRKNVALPTSGVSSVLCTAHWRPFRSLLSPAMELSVIRSPVLNSTSAFVFVPWSVSLQNRMHGYNFPHIFWLPYFLRDFLRRSKGVGRWIGQSTERKSVGSSIGLIRVPFIASPI